ncbi:MAG: hypothetical protein ACRD6N_03990 [Pyrinomonadaceae bacterium]
MNTRLVRQIIGLILAALLLTGLVILSATTAAAQGRDQRRVVQGDQRHVVIVRPIDRPFRHFRRYDPFGYQYGRFDRSNYYRQYVFSSSDKAYNEGYKDGLKTGEKDGRKDKSYDPERSHYFGDAGFGNFAEVYRDGFSNGYRDGFRAQRVG